MGITVKEKTQESQHGKLDDRGVTAEKQVYVLYHRGI